ncbi:MAG: nucleotidyltransferase domain-containing protein [Eggerthellaceae bacterium]|nr:nucleotidyltransferase domain-containing protein [Eggerthellaceae bacterium]
MTEQPNNDRVYSIEELRDIVAPFAKERGFRWARLFGSYARGDADGRSDIDVLVDRGDARALSVCGLANHVCRRTGKQADVFDIAEVDPGPFRDAIMREAVILWA